MRAIRLGDENEPDTGWVRFRDLLSRHPWRTATAGVVTFLIGAGSLWALVDERPLIPVVIAAARTAVPSGAWSMRNVVAILVFALILIGVTLPFVVAFAAAHYRREFQRVGDELAAVKSELDRVQANAGHINAALKELADYKRDVAHRTLHRMRGMKINDRQPTVTIRFAAYGKDFDLVKRLEEIVSVRIGWQVTKDGTNNPALAQAGEFKVVFVSRFSMAFDELSHAFSEGDLLGVSVGRRMDFDDVPDTHRLIIEVLPSA